MTKITFFERQLSDQIRRGLKAPVIVVGPTGKTAVMAAGDVFNYVAETYAATDRESVLLVPAYVARY
jgi:hypothetical protein